MGRRRRSGPKIKKPKKVSYELIREDDEIHGVKMYGMLNDAVKRWHDDLTNARILLAWNHTWKADVDGRVKLGMCKKASDLDRELVNVGKKPDKERVDFIVILQKTFWLDESASDNQRMALLDHELSHAALRLDANGEPVEDERGRKVYRIRKHDVEEFVQVIERHGFYKRDLESLAGAMQKVKTRGKTLFDDGEPPPKQAGPRPVPKKPNGSGDQPAAS